MSPDRDQGGGELHRFPRVSGDEPLERSLELLARLFSPRERG